jgi:hypothetical protein
VLGDVVGHGVCLPAATATEHHPQQPVGAWRRHLMRLGRPDVEEVIEFFEFALREQREELL